MAFASPPSKSVRDIVTTSLRAFLFERYNYSFTKYLSINEGK